MTKSYLHISTILRKYFIPIYFPVQLIYFVFVPAWYLAIYPLHFSSQFEVLRSHQCLRLLFFIWFPRIKLDFNLSLQVHYFDGILRTVDGIRQPWREYVSRFCTGHSSGDPCKYIDNVWFEYVSITFHKLNLNFLCAKTCSYINFFYTSRANFILSSMISFGCRNFLLDT